MAINPMRRMTYSNIITKLKHQVNINPRMIIKEEKVGEKKKKDGKLEYIYKHTLNIDFWKKIKEPINVVLDEAHSIINSRRAMSKINIIITDWISLIRRVLGQTEAGYGELVFITQLPKRIDIIARDMCTNLVYTVCHYVKSCKKCRTSWQENSEMPEALWVCPKCQNYNILKHSHTLEVWHFPNMSSYEIWNDFAQKTFYKHYYITDIENYFKLYNTLQWDNMFSEFY